MKINKPIEKIVLTEKEAQTLEKAYEIVMDIKDESETIASDYAETVMDALNDLIHNPSSEQNYTIGYEKQEKQKMIFVAVEI